MAKSNLQIGQMVHYVLPHGASHDAHRPALVTAVVENGAANLCVFSDAADQLPGLFHAANVERSDKFAPGTYHLPEKG